MIDIGDVVEITAEGPYKGLRFVLDVIAEELEVGLLFAAPFYFKGDGVQWFEEFEIRKVNEDCDSVSEMTFHKVIETVKVQGQS